MLVIEKIYLFNVSSLPNNKCPLIYMIYPMNLLNIFIIFHTCPMRNTIRKMCCTHGYTKMSFQWVEITYFFGFEIMIMCIYNRMGWRLIWYAVTMRWVYGLDHILYLTCEWRKQYSRQPSLWEEPCKLCLRFYVWWLYFT